MANLATLAVGVDKREYSRFETDKNTIRITVAPGVPKTTLAVASVVGGMSLTVASTSALPTTFPYSITLGCGDTAETVTVLSRFGTTLNLSTTLLFAHSIGEIVKLVVSLSGEQVVLQLIKARRNRDVIVCSQTITLTGPAVTNATATIVLKDILDENAATKVRRGDYFIRAISITDPTVFGDSPDFKVALISVDRFRREFLHGVDTQALDTEMVKNQPQLITGLSIDFVSRGHNKGWIPLSYNYSTPGGCITPVRILSWCNGPVVPVRDGQTSYTLRRGNSSTDYIDVSVISIDSLPTQSIAEEILVDREALQDSVFRSQIDRTITWIEETALNCYLEPTRVVTEVDASSIAFAPGTDTPTFVNSDFDQVVQAVTYARPSAGHWINFRMPYFPIIQFLSLYGKTSNVRILDVALEWIETHERGGFVELVPFNQETAFNFIGLVWVESMRGPIPIPNFWNFDALVGFRDTPEDLIELVGKRAAIEALTLAGQAFRPGISSQSVSRDGISESVSYLTSGQYGIFSATIKTYQEWIDKNLVMMAGSYRGINMLVV